jgi:hypothetical protein
MELHPNHRAAVFVVQAPILFPEAVPHLTLEGFAAPILQTKIDCRAIFQKRAEISCIFSLDFL